MGLEDMILKYAVLYTAIVSTLLKPDINILLWYLIYVICIFRRFLSIILYECNNVRYKNLLGKRYHVRIRERFYLEEVILVIQNIIVILI